MSFLFLCLQTLSLWLLVVWCHRFRQKITIIPLYSLLAVLTLLTHNFSDLGFTANYRYWVFLVASFSFFTPMIFGVLLLYLFDGPRAARLALWTIFFSSIVYIFVVIMAGMITDTSAWVSFKPISAWYYFWSLLAIFLDIILMAVSWEFLSKFRAIPLLFRTILVIILVLSIDTIIFTTGVFGGSSLYLTILAGNLLTRFALAFFGAIFVTVTLEWDDFNENTRKKPKVVTEILNFKSDLEVQIEGLKEEITVQKKLENELFEAKETLQMAINGSGAGIWDWDMRSNKIKMSPRFCELLGYAQGEISEDRDGFKKIMHPEDLDRTEIMIQKSVERKENYQTEFRLKTKSGKYKWFISNGTIKFDEQNQPVRMVGSIIDIDDRKLAEQKINDKVSELIKLNQLMVDRELQMAELKGKTKKK